MLTDIDRLMEASVQRGSDFDKNNLDLIRLMMASIVALFHISALTQLPAFALLGHYLSPHFAVNSFFVISGMLIYRSYQRSSSQSSYFEKRFRRIYPGYLVIIVLSSIALAALSTLHTLQYFTSPIYWRYLAANLVFLNFLGPNLPGVFASNPMTEVNGALWTLKIEVMFYLLVPIIFRLCRRFGVERVIAGLFVASFVWKYGFALLGLKSQAHALFSQDPTRTIFDQISRQFPGQLFYFCAGILVLLHFELIRRHFGVITIASVCLFALDQFFSHGLLDVFWITGFVIVFGFSRYAGNFSKHGDFSYGVYIVHWPVLQVCIALGMLSIPPVAFLLSATGLIALAGFALWHGVEKHFLKRSSHYRGAVPERKEVMVA